MADRYFVGGGTGNWNSTTNWSTSSGGSSGASVPGASDAVIIDANSGANTLTVNVASAALSINTAGSSGFAIVCSAKLSVSGSINFTNLGTFTPNTQTVEMKAAGTITSNSKSFYNFQFYSGNYTVTLADNMTCTNNLDFYYANAIGVKCDGYKIYVGKDVTFSDVNTFRYIGNETGTTVIEFTGSGDHAISGGNSIANAPTLGMGLIINTSGATTFSNYLRFDSEITFTTGDVDFTGFFWFGSATSRSITYTAGTISQSTASFRFGGSGGSSAYTLSSAFLTALGDITGNLQFYQLPTITLQADMTVNGDCDFMYSNGTGVILNGASYKLNIEGSILFSDSGTYPNVPYGTATVVMTGTGTLNGGNGGWGLNLTINTSGTITLPNATFKFGRSGSTPTLTYTAGTISTTSGNKLQIMSSVSLGTNGISWYDITQGANITLGSDLTLTNNWARTAGAVSGAYNVILNGNSTLTGSSTFTGLTVNAGKTITFTAGTTQTVTSLTCVGAGTTLQSSTTSAWGISKSSGTVTIQNTTLIYSAASGGATFNSYTTAGNTDGGHNTGWLFAEPVLVSGGLMLLGVG